MTDTQDPQEPLIEEHEFQDAAGRTTFFLSSGPPHGPLMILCHGWPAIAMTWTNQLHTFSALGFRVIAPDMPGYGKSYISRNQEDYSLEAVNLTMLALLQHCGREQAIWVGHDWGAVSVWSFAAHFPEHTAGVIGLARPYHTLEYGLDEVLATINRDIFPHDQYPFGQYDYQVYFEREFERASTWFDQDPAGVLRAIYARGNPAEVGKPGVTATVTKDGGWFGGAARPPAQLHQIPSAHMCIGDTLFADVVAAMTRTGFRSANAWYTNHARNRAYSAQARHGGHLDMPVLFVGANWDAISDVAVSTVAAAQRTHCRRLTEVNLDAGHWVALEKPVEVNAAIAAWLADAVPDVWRAARAAV